MQPPKCEDCGQDKKDACNSQGFHFWTCYRCRKRRERERRESHEASVDYERVLGTVECPSCGEMSLTNGVCVGECNCYVPTPEQIAAEAALARQRTEVKSPRTGAVGGVRTFHGVRVARSVIFTEVR
jgi:ribosomal protein L32